MVVTVKTALVNARMTLHGGEVSWPLGAELRSLGQGSPAVDDVGSALNEGDPVVAYRVFLSHSSTDVVLARSLVAALEDAGAEVFFAPRDIPVGTSYIAEIQAAIARSHGFLVLLSGAALASDQVKHEMHAAVDGKREIFPFRLADWPPFNSDPTWSWWFALRQVATLSTETDLITAVRSTLAKRLTTRPPGTVLPLGSDIQGASPANSILPRETLAARSDDLPHSDSDVTGTAAPTSSDAKAAARTLLAELNLPDPPGGWRDKGWLAYDRDGGSGYPSVILRGADLPGKRHLVVQIETDRAAPGERFLANVGISVTESDFAARKRSIPVWTTYARTIGEFLEPRLLGSKAEISRNSARGRGPDTPATRKIGYARAAGLPLHYATGYTDSYVGVKTGKVRAEDLQALVTALLPSVYELDSGPLRVEP